MAQQGQALMGYFVPCFSHSITSLHMPKITTPAGWRFAKNVHRTFSLRSALRNGSPVD